MNYRAPEDLVGTIKHYMGEPFGWPPSVFNSIPLPQLIALFGEHEDQPRYIPAAELLDHINAERALAGLPPIPPRQRS